VAARRPGLAIAEKQDGKHVGCFAVFVALHVVLVWRHVNFNWAG
jgi:hypothetical protein